MKKKNPFRRSPKIGKQILHLKVRDFLSSCPFRVGIDVGCAKMNYRLLFKTKYYIGIDLDKKRLEKGLKKYPDAKSLCFSVFNIPDDIKGDLIVCIQTIQANNKFDDQRTMEAIKKLIKITNKGGSLIFNINSYNKNAREDGIRRCLKDNFDYIEIDEIGFYDRPLPHFLSFSIAFVIKFMPFLYHITKPKYILFKAKYKK